MAQTVTLIETGVANIASVRAAFRRLDAELTPAQSAEEIASADRVILPGVGAFAAGMAHLSQDGVGEALKARIAAGRPTLTICLGLQLLAESSEESPGVVGLGVLPLSVTRFSGPQRVPQLGWNTVAASPENPWISSSFAYFANSYRLTEAPAGWDVAWADYGGPFVAAIRRGEVLACQFHPELSGAYGAGLLGRWLKGGFRC